MTTLPLRLAVATLAISLHSPAVSPASAQQSDAPAGSPAATRAIDGLQLPAPDEPFGGKIERNALQSTLFWQPRIAPPEGAPNVLLIMTDDVGFGAPSTFGGVIPTPALDRIAAMGLRYTNMHSTALCSPTRAALLTGRNHHSVGFGVIAEQATGFPGYDSVITKDKATIGTILKDNGYNTSWYGKNHNTPGYQISMAGPFDQWPTGMGFDYFYGFMGGDTSQWTPGNLFRDTTPDLSVRDPAGLQPDHRDGGRGDRLHGSARHPRARPAVARLLRPGRHPRAAPSDAGMDRPRSRTCTCSTTAGTSCATRSSPIRRSWA